MSAAPPLQVFPPLLPLLLARPPAYGVTGHLRTPAQLPAPPNSVPSLPLINNYTDFPLVERAVRQHPSRYLAILTTRRLKQPRRWHQLGLPILHLRRHHGFTFPQDIGCLGFPYLCQTPTPPPPSHAGLLMGWWIRTDTPLALWVPLLLAHPRPLLMVEGCPQDVHARVLQLLPLLLPWTRPQEAPMVPRTPSRLRYGRNVRVEPVPASLPPLGACS